MRTLASSHRNEKLLGFPGGSEVLECGRPGFDPWVRKIPRRRKWQLTPAFLPGEFHGRRSLAGYRLQRVILMSFSFAPLFFYGMRQGKEKGETIIPKVLDQKILKVRFPTLPF